MGTSNYKNVDKRKERAFITTWNALIASITFKLFK